MATAKHNPFSYIFIGEANKNIDPAKEVRATPEEPSAFEMVPSLRFGKIMRLQTFFPPASLAVRYGFSRKRESIAPEAAQVLHFERCSCISVICAKFQGLTERSSSGARGEFLSPLESAFFDTFFHASAERKYEKAEFSETPWLRAVGKL